VSTLPSPESARPLPPVARRIERIREVHGDRLVDEYDWLREKDRPEVREYLEAENAYAAEMMGGTAELQRALYREMLGRIQETDQEVPYRLGGFFYYSRTEEGRQYPIYCRRKGSLHAPEQVTLDLNALAEGRPYMALGAYELSDDGRLLAYTTDDTGFRQYTLFVKDLGSEALPARLAEKVGSVAWAADGSTLFYTVEEEGTKRQHRLFRYRLGDRTSDLVFEEGDAAFSVSVSRTRSRAYLLVDVASLTTSEVRFLDAGEPEGEWRLLAPRVHEQEYEVAHRGDVFYVRVNDTGGNFRLVTAPVSSPARGSWTELVPHRENVMLESAECFRDHLVLLEREGGLPQIGVTDLRTGSRHRLAFPDATYAAWPESNAEFDTRTLRFSYQSLVTPPSVFDYDMDARTTTLLKVQPVLGGYDACRYETERILVPVADGAEVPVSLVRRKGVLRDGTAPLYLYAYGSYGLPLPVAFSSNRVSLLDRGVVFALVHVRGGGEMGKRWHDAGRMLNKRNSFTDFIASAELLLARGYGSRDRLVIEGGSAGGLLAGAVTNMRPDLWKAVVSKVPFVDVVNTMLDETLPLTVGEFEEWGNPREEVFYRYIRTYCPYTNLERKAYPAILVRTSLNDSQVMYWEPAKYVARLRALKTDTNPLLLRTDMDAGHGGASGRYDYLREVAFDFAFALTQMGIRR
jgi:oligopeptidase B